MKKTNSVGKKNMSRRKSMSYGNEQNGVAMFNVLLYKRNQKFFNETFLTFFFLFFVFMSLWKIDEINHSILECV